MRAWLAFVLFLAMSLPALAQDLLSPAEFRDAGIALIRARDPNAQIDVRDDFGINVRRAPSDPQSELFINFDNSYQEYRNSPERMQEILDRLVRLALTPPDATPTRERVVSVVRSRVRVEGYRAAYAQANPPAEIVARPLVGDLYEVIVYDSEEAVQLASRQSLQQLGLSEEEAWIVARANIPARMGDVTVSTFEAAPRGVTLVSGGNGLAPSSLLQADICVGAAGDLFLVPDREGYWRAAARDAQAVAFLRGFASHLIGSGQSESSSVLTCRDERLSLLVQ